MKPPVSQSLPLVLIVWLFSWLSPGFAAPDYWWDLGVLEKWALEVPPETAAHSGCFELRGWQLRGFRDRLRELAGETAPPPFAVQSPVTLWPGGVVYYVFDAPVTVAQRRIFLDAAADLSAFAAVSFVPWTSQPNYSLVKNVPGLGGGVSAIGMVGAAQTFDIGEGSWNRGTLLHEMGHTLGLVHEHQRPDRDAFVTIQTANILPGTESNFVVLAATTTGAYDFLSVMHYRRDSLSRGAGLDTIVPEPAYAAFADLMGNQYPRPLSTLDRAGLAATYGPGAPASTVVTNTLAGGTGSLTVAIYRAVDAPGSTITFNIPTTDPGYDTPSGMWTIHPTDQLPKLGRLTTLDANVTANRLEGNFIGTNAAGTATAPNLWSGVGIFTGPVGNLIGGSAAARNLISGNANHGLAISGAGVTGNLVSGNFIGTDPRVSTSRLALLLPTTSGNDLLVNIAATNGRPFTLERSSDLQTWTAWSDSLLGTGAAQTFTDPGALAEPRRFYRARLGF